MSASPRAVLITGIAGGQGREAALRFAAAGDHVIGCDISHDGVDETLDAIADAGGRADGRGGVDLANPQACQDWIEWGAGITGRIDVLYNNASAARFGSLETMSYEDWQFTLRNELDLVFLATKFAWPYLKERGGVVLNTGSIAGIIAGGAGNTAHATTKAGVIALTRQIAIQGAPFGIRAVSISPGAIRTPGTAAIFDAPGVEEAQRSSTLVGRVGEPSDISGLALFLASDEAGFITGVDIVADGGRVAAAGRSAPRAGGDHS